MKKWWLLGALLVSPSVLACINAPPTTDHAGRSFETFEFSGEAMVTMMTTPGMVTRMGTGTRPTSAASGSPRY